MAVLKKIPFCVLFYRKSHKSFTVQGYGNVRFCYHAETKAILDMKVNSIFASYRRLWGRPLLLLAEVNL